MQAIVHIVNDRAFAMKASTIFQGPFAGLGAGLKHPSAYDDYGISWKVENPKKHDAGLAVAHGGCVATCDQPIRGQSLIAQRGYGKSAGGTAHPVRGVGQGATAHGGETSSTKRRGTAGGQMPKIGQRAQAVGKLECHRVGWHHGERDRGVSGFQGAACPNRVAATMSDF